MATVIHEATHQIAYNCGLQTRYADIPLWISEGIAVYFETPDLPAPRDGADLRFDQSIAARRLCRLRRTSRAADSLRRLIMDDTRFRDTSKALDAYAEAWALNYFLIHQRPKQYRAYLQVLAEKKQLIWDEPSERLAEFTAAFGDITALDTDFQRYVVKMLH